MARKPDWLKVAFDLHREAEGIRDAAPDGVTVSLALSDYGNDSGAFFTISLTHAAQKLSGWGMGGTPAKALKAAVADLEKNRRERAATPTITAAPVPALPAKAE